MGTFRPRFFAVFVGLTKGDGSIHRVDAGVPEEKYNIYLEFESVTIVLENGSVPPNAAEAVELLKGAISVDYIMNIPRKMTGTSFESTNEAYLATL
jgi:hypothetical protein